jgi:CTP:molybdopterin cytidylyltransferase MocA
VRSAVVEDVEVEEQGITQDVDTPADYERLRGTLR